VLSENLKIPVAREHDDVVPYAQLCKEGINRSNLHTLTPALVAQCSRVGGEAAREFRRLFDRPMI